MSLSGWNFKQLSSPEKIDFIFSFRYRDDSDLRHGAHHGFSNGGEGTTGSVSQDNGQHPRVSQILAWTQPRWTHVPVALPLLCRPGPSQKHGQGSISFLLLYKAEPTEDPGKKELCGFQQQACDKTKRAFVDILTAGLVGESCAKPRAWWSCFQTAVFCGDKGTILFILTTPAPLAAWFLNLFSVDFAWILAVKTSRDTNAKKCQDFRSDSKLQWHIVASSWNRRNQPRNFSWGRVRQKTPTVRILWNVEITLKWKKWKKQVFIKQDFSRSVTSFAVCETFDASCFGVYVTSFPAWHVGMGRLLLSRGTKPWRHIKKHMCSHRR